MNLTNKTILITSSNAWGKMHISKHHYAKELAKRNNIVYFLNPPQYELNKRIIIENVLDNLFVISYKPFFLFKIRFHFRLFFDLLIKFQINYILKKTSKKIDVLISFETNLFSNLTDFHAKLNIYFPVDMIIGKYQKNLLNSADLVFSVSNEIINKIKNITERNNVFFINHGLSKEFISNYNENSIFKKDKINVCFSGNLFIYSLDRKTFKTIIQENQQINFHIYSPYKVEETNLGGFCEKESLDFIEFLKTCRNVILKGVVETKLLSEEIGTYNAFILLINTQFDINKGSNSHKILEYLSKGKVIISSHISTYYKTGLIEMVDELHNENYPALFQKVISNLEYYNNPELQRKRIEYALDNTYEKQIERIEKIINENF
jgi:hypothetical protein